MVAMEKIWSAMEDSIIEGSKITDKSPSGMSGGNAQKLLTYAKESPFQLLSGSIVAKATARAIAVGEYNSSFGKDLVRSNICFVIDFAFR